MRSIRCILALALLLGLSAIASPLAASEPTGLSVSVSISPTPNRPDDCLCKAEISS